MEINHVMASIKAILRRKKNSQGRYPIAIRITQNRKSSFFYIGQQIELKYWDAKNARVKKSHPNSVRINHLIAKKLAEANDKLIEAETKGEKTVSAKYIKSLVKGEKGVNDFFVVAGEYLINLELRKKFSQLSADKPRIEYFKKYLGQSQMPFNEITPTLLNRFKTSLETKGKPFKEKNSDEIKFREVSERTIQNHLVVIRTIFNLAIREGIVERKYYPFGKGKIVIRFPQTQKKGLTEKEVKKLENADLSHKPDWDHARRVWLWLFYLGGQRISDALNLKWSDIKEGRLYYQMGKNKKSLSLKIPDKALKLLEHYKRDLSGNDDFIFPEMKNVNLTDEKEIYKSITRNTKRLNGLLKQIAEYVSIKSTVTCHIARHSFATIGGSKIPIEILQKLYRHSNISTTINYQSHFIHDDEDNALEKVLNF